MHANDESILSDMNIYEALHRAAPPKLKEWMGARRMVHKILAAIQPMFFNLSDGHFRPKRIIFASARPSADHDSALMMLRYKYAPVLSAWLRGRIMGDKSEISTSELAKVLSDIYLEFIEDGYGPNSVEGHILVPAIKFNSTSYAVVRAGGWGEPLFHLLTNYAPQSEDLPLSSWLEGNTKTLITVVVLANAGYSEHDRAQVMEPIVSVEIPNPMLDQNLRSRIAASRSRR
jgi:hypothetical protein